MTDPTPYADAANIYTAAGWIGVLPLPAKAKHSPPTGYTGDTGTYPSVTELDEWRAHRGTGNIGLRMAPDTIGIDVDAYGTKTGGATLADLEDELGPLPPTATSTSRDDGVSGIRFYRLPEPVRLIGALPGIEIIQRHHRYAVVWPSIHPEGRQYRWISADGEVVDVPHVDELPYLPAAWIEHLRADRHTPRQRQALASGVEVAPAVERALGAAMIGMNTGTRHDTTLRGVGALTRLADLDYPGADGALATLESAFLSAVTADGSRSDREAAGEWQRMIDGAAAEIAATPSTAPRWEPRPPPPDAHALGLAAIATTAHEADVEASRIAADVERGDWAPVDLADVVGGNVEPPQPELLAPPSGPALIYRGRVNSLFGESGTGKTWVALAAIVEVVQAGGRALLIDLEDTPHGIVSRLIALGLTATQITDQIDYVSPSTAWGPVAAASVAALVDEGGHDLVVIDSTGEAMAAAGVKGNNDDEVAAWFRHFPRFLADRGPGVIVIDHVPKDPNAPTTYAIGSQRKIAAVNGAAYRVDAVRVPSKVDDGLLKIVCAKDRHGNHTKGKVAAMLGLSHGLTGAVTIALSTPTEDAREEDGSVRPTIIMERISRLLEETPNLSGREIESRTKGRAQLVREATRLLLVEGWTSTEVATGKGGGFRYHVVKPYRCDAESSDVPCSTGEPRPTSSNRVLPHGGRGSPQPRPPLALSKSGDAVGDRPAGSEDAQPRPEHPDTPPEPVDNPPDDVDLSWLDS